MFFVFSKPTTSACGCHLSVKFVGTKCGVAPVDWSTCLLVSKQETWRMPVGKATSDRR